MDLKGSLVDTNLRIYPSEKLMQFLKTIPTSDQIPHNILQIKEAHGKNTFKCYKLQDLKQVQFNSSELRDLKNIRESFGEILNIKSIENESKIIDSEIKANTNDSEANIKVREQIKDTKSKCEDNENQKSSNIKSIENDSKIIDSEIKANTNDSEANIKVREKIKDTKSQCEDNENQKSSNIKSIENDSKIIDSEIKANTNDSEANIKVREQIKDSKSTCEDNENQKSSKEGLNDNDDSASSDIRPFLVTSDIDWLFLHIRCRKSNGEKDIPYLHTLLEGASIEMPENEKIKRNPILEARCVKLRAQQEAREYRKMTKGVDNVRMRFPEDSISYQMKQLNRHLIAIGQFIISIFAGFLFGFRGVEWMVGNLDFGFRLLLGVMCALVIALAEIYFLAKKLNEELCIPDTVQLGGPVKFADQDSYNYKNNEPETKPHQD